MTTQEVSSRRKEKVIGNMPARLSSPKSTSDIRVAGWNADLKDFLGGRIAGHMTALYYADGHYLEMALADYVRKGTKGKTQISPDGRSRDRFRLNMPGHESLGPFKSRWIDKARVIQLEDGGLVWRIYLTKDIEIVSGEMQAALAGRLDTARHQRAPDKATQYIADMEIVGMTAQRMADILGPLEEPERMAVLDIVRRGFHHK